MVINKIVLIILCIFCQMIIFLEQVTAAFSLKYAAIHFESADGRKASAGTFDNDLLSCFYGTRRDLLRTGKLGKELSVRRRGDTKTRQDPAVLDRHEIDRPGYPDTLTRIARIGSNLVFSKFGEQFPMLYCGCRGLRTLSALIALHTAAKYDEQRG